MTSQTSEDRVGERIRLRRQSLGKSLRVVAGLAGITSSTLSRIETGVYTSSNRFVIARIAEALQCPVEQLTGVVVPGGRDGAETTAAAHATIRALVDADLEFPPATGHLEPIAALTERTTKAIELRQACDYAALTRQLPALVTDLYAATAGDDQAQALRLLTRVAEAASFAVRYTGNPGAATVASDRARQAAVMLGDPVMIAFGEWARSHSALGCGLHDRSALITSRAIAALDHHDDLPDDSGRLEMLGMLHLTHAFSLVGAGRHADAVPALAEANVLARHTGETDTLALMFGETNVRLWELAILTDGGDPIDAIPLLAQVNPRIIPSISRQTTFYIDGARALAKTGDPDRAVQFFETAERLAPQRVHGDPIVVETVRGLLDHARRRATGVRLQGLAQRVGVAA
jgi:transcriptional regulator with XRE-family HTH domain